MFGLVVLASSSTLYGKVPRLILKNTNRLMQAVVVSSRSHFLCGAFLCNCSSAEEREGLFSRTLYAQHPVGGSINETQYFEIYEFMNL